MKFEENEQRYPLVRNNIKIILDRRMFLIIITENNWWKTFLCLVSAFYKYTLYSVCNSRHCMYGESHRDEIFFQQSKSMRCYLAFDDSSTYSNLKGRVFFEDVADLGNAKGKEDLTLF